MNQQSTYQILKKKRLSNQEKEDIQELVKACCIRECLRLSYSFEPGTSHYLLYLKQGNGFCLAAAVRVLPYDDTLAECIAFTHPDHRRQGYFSVLFDCVLEDFDETDLLFPVSGQTGNALAVLEHLEAAPQATELQMELSLEDTVIPELKQTAPELSLVPGVPAQDGELLQLVGNDSLLLGTCQLSPAGYDCLCLHHVEILEAYRGRGYGFAMMSLLFRRLARENICRLILQVSGDNAPALALYKKTGFRITETLSYYLY